MKILAPLSPGLHAARHWFTSKEPRERKALSLLGAFVLCLLAWHWVWQPLEVSKAAALRNYRAARSAFVWMQVNADHVNPLTASELQPSDQPLLTLATDLAQQQTLTLKHAEPGEGGSLHVTLEQANFNHLLLWLQGLRQLHGVRFTQIAVQQQDAPGLVNADITLQTP